MSKKHVDEYVKRLWREKDLSAVEDLFAQDAIIHTPVAQAQGPDHIKEVIEEWITAFPDLEVTKVRDIEEGDVVVRQWTATATHKGNFRGISPTGRPIRYMGANAYRFHNGKIVEYWAYVDVSNILRQLIEKTTA